MKINKKTKSLKAVYITIISLVIVIIATVGTYTYFSAQSTTPDQTKINNVDYEEPSKDQLEAGQDIKKGSIEYENETTNDNSIIITAKEYDGSVLRIRTSIHTISNSGVCNLTLEKNGVTVSRSVEIQALASNSTCKGFDIPVEELTGGTWSIKIDFVIDGSTSTTKSEVII